MLTPQTGPSPLTPAQLFRSQSAQWRQIVAQATNDLRVSIPAFLVSGIDPATQTVRAQIAIQERVKTSSGMKWYDVPPILNVPVILPRGGGYSFTLPLQAGDKGLLIFCDACFDLWWSNGTEDAPKADNAQQPSGSQRQLEVRRHHFWDCGFLPGMWTQKDLLPGYSTTSAQIRSDDGTVVIDISSSGVSITAPQVNIHVTGNASVSAENVTVTGSQSVTVSGNGNTSIEGRNFLEHTHSGVQPGSGSSGPVV